MKTISIAKARAGMVLAQDIYVSDSSNSAFVRRGTVLSWELIDRLWNRGILQLHIDDGAARAPQRQPTSAADARAMSHTGVVLQPPAVPGALRDEAVATLHSTFSALGDIGREDLHASAQSLSQLDAVVARLVASVQSNSHALVNIANLKSHDDYTYHHSLSVAVLAIGIGRHLRLPEKLMNHLGLTAILHDVGKMAIPAAVIQKPGRLSPDEYTLVKTHAFAGSSRLVESAVGSEPLWSGVLYHHEKVDGSGYPNGLKGEEIPLWSRIIAVADVYDALTSARPYRRPMQPAEALEYLMGGSDTAFDFDIVSALVRIVDLYPLGSLLELSDGRYGLVVDNDMQLRPVVELLGSGDVVDLFRDRQMMNVVVKRVVPENEVLIVK
ncbi:MAG: HD-GYP domain-containing protein [Oscillospiraceae bacterium]